MSTQNYWHLRLTDLKKALETNNFEVFMVEDKSQAKEIVLKRIIPDTGARRISRGDSVTCLETGVFEEIANNPEIEFTEPFAESQSFEEMLDRLRQTLQVDLFITGVNAVTEKGQLVSLDMLGNRVGGMTFGPKFVAILVGRNKIAPGLEEAMFRIKNYAAPANAARLHKRTPCTKTSRCEECKSPDRICNTWTIMEKSFPPARVKVILINEDLGL